MTITITTITATVINMITNITIITTMHLNPPMHPCASMHGWVDACIHIMH
jgi:hypothetical protein